MAAGITVGNFDGVHLGHREIVARLISLAQPLGLPSVALTFDPHPAELLHPSFARRFLTTTQRRAELLLSLGLDAVFVLNTTPELLNLSAEEFYREVLCRCFHPAVIAEGEDFHFGHNRQGTLSDLQRWADRDSIELTTSISCADFGHCSLEFKNTWLVRKRRCEQTRMNCSFSIQGRGAG